MMDFAGGFCATLVPCLPAVRNWFRSDEPQVRNSAERRRAGTALKDKHKSLLKRILEKIVERSVPYCTEMPGELIARRAAYTL